MTGEEVQAKMLKLNEKMYKLNRQEERYKRYISRQIDHVRLQMREITKQCPHKDNGGMFHAVCEYCGLVD